MLVIGSVLPPLSWGATPGHRLQLTNPADVPHLIRFPDRNETTAFFYWLPPDPSTIRV